MGDNIQGNLRPEIISSVPSSPYIAHTRVIKDRNKTPYID